MENDESAYIIEALPSNLFARARGKSLDVSACAAVALQGRRSSMEDAFCARSIDLGDAGVFDVFAVFDGHGGHQAASYCRRHLHLHVRVAFGQLCFQEEESTWIVAVREALRAAIISLNNAFESVQGGSIALEVGSTAVVALVGRGHVWTANVGDSRAVLSSSKQDQSNTIALSHDHSPSRADERKRIEDAGGFIQYIPRAQVYYVGGMLAMTRSIGDVNMRPFVTCAPDVTVHAIDASADEFIVLATDGLWDVFGNADATAALHAWFRANEESERQYKPEDKALYAVRRLAHAAVQERGTSDNVTVMMIVLAKTNDERVAVAG